MSELKNAKDMNQKSTKSSNLLIEISSQYEVTPTSYTVIYILFIYLFSIIY